MCVCETLGVTGVPLILFFFWQGDWSRFAYPAPRSYGLSVTGWSDQPLVPACSDLETSYWSPLLTRTKTPAIALVCVGSHASDFGALQLGGLWGPRGGHRFLFRVLVPLLLGFSRWLACGKPHSSRVGTHFLSVCVCVTLGIIGILSDCFRFTVVFLV